MDEKRESTRLQILAEDFDISTLVTQGGDQSSRANSYKLTAFISAEGRWVNCL